MKTPFASRLVEFDTTPKPLRITDQGYIVPVEREDQEKESALMPVEGLFLPPASIPAQIIVKGICRNRTVTIETM